MKKALLIVLFSVSNAFTYTQVFNPFTGKPDFIGQPGASAFSGMILRDSLNHKWLISVTTAGNLVTTANTGSAVLSPTALVTQDASFNFWTITVTSAGNLVTTAGGSSNQSIHDLILNDSDSHSWVIAITTSGNLVTT